MIDYVSPGQKIQASTVNSLIANANYVGTPTTTYQFTTGPDGHIDYSISPVLETGNFVTNSDSDFLFKASVNVLKEKSLPTWSFYLGLTSSDCEKAINGYLGQPPAKALDEETEISVLGLGYKFKSGDAKKLEESDISANGWLSTDLKWPDNGDIYLYQFYDKKKDDDKENGQYSSSGSQEDEEDKTLNIGLFLTDKTTFGQVKSDAKSLFDLSGDAEEIGGIMVAMTKQLSGALSGTYSLIQCAYPPFGSEQIRPLTDSESKGGKEVKESDTKYSKTKSMQWSDDLDAYQLYNFDFKTTKESQYPSIPYGYAYDKENSNYQYLVYPAEGFGDNLSSKGAFLWKRDPLSNDLSSGPTLEYGMLSIDVIKLGSSYLQAIVDNPGQLSDISGDLSGLSGLSDLFRPKTDSEVSSCKSSSLEWLNEHKAYRIWNFELSGDQPEKLKSKLKEPVPLSDCVMFRTYDPTKVQLSVGEGQTAEREIGWKVDYAMNSQLLLETDASVSAYVSKPQGKSIQVDWQASDIDKNQGAEVRVASLYKFNDAPADQAIPAKVEQADDLSNVLVQVPEPGKGDILWRKKDEATGKYELSYGQISVNIPFAQISADLSGLSALEVYADSEKGHANTLCAITSGKSKTLGLWNFSQGDSIASDSELDQKSKYVKDGDSATVFLTKDGNSLGYTKVKLDLSAAPQVSADAPLGKIQTIDNIGTDDKPVFSLYNFEGNSGTAVLTADKDNQVVTENGNAAVFLYKTADSNELKYGTLSIDLSAQISGLSSGLSADGKTIDEENKVLQLHNFKSHTTHTLVTDKNGIAKTSSGQAATFLCDTGTGNLEYATLSVQTGSQLSVKGDSRSVNVNFVGGNTYEVALRGFIGQSGTALKNGDGGTVVTPTGSVVNLLYRDGGTLHYGSLTISSDTTVSVDNDSIEYDINDKLQIKGWDGGTAELQDYTAYIKQDDKYSYYNGSDVVMYLGTGDQSAGAAVAFLGKDYTKTAPQYVFQNIKLPPPPRGDSGNVMRSAGGNSYSISEYYNSDKAYYSLFNFNTGSGTDNTIDLNWGQKYEIFGGNSRILYRSMVGDSPTLAYGKLSLKMPEKPESSSSSEISGLSSAIDDVNDKIDQLSGRIDDINDQLKGLQQQLSGDYWQQGGGSDNCFGSSIGDSSKHTVIDLNGRALRGIDGGIGLQWDGVSMRSPNGSFNTLYANYFSIGSTTLSESDLIALKALIS